MPIYKFKAENEETRVEYFDECMFKDFLIEWLELNNTNPDFAEALAEMKINAAYTQPQLVIAGNNKVAQIRIT